VAYKNVCKRRIMLTTLLTTHQWMHRPGIPKPKTWLKTQQQIAAIIT